MQSVLFDKIVIVRKKQSSLLYRALFERMEIVFMPRSSAGFRLSFYPWVVIILALAWTLLTVYALSVTTKNIDYGVTKADNKILKTKLALIAEEITRNRRYIKLARDTDNQMRQMLGMEAGKYINLPTGLEEGKESRAVSFKEILSRRAQEIDEQELAVSLKETTDLVQQRLESFQEIAWFYANQKNITDATPSIKPVENGRISSGFGYRLSPRPSFHYGLDFGGQPNTKIMVTADGVVRQTGWVSGYGQAVLVDHGFGYSSLYGHLADIRVKAGDTVKRGQVIANMGTTGRSTGVHLHYEVWKDGTPVNPKSYF